MDEDGKSLIGVVRPLRRVVIRLRGAHLAFDDRIDELEVARVRGERDGDVAARRLPYGFRAEVVLHVSGAGLEVGRHRLEHALPLELAQDRVRLPADRVGEHVEAPAMRHADDDVVGAVRSRELDRLVEHRHHDVESLDRELLLTEKGPSEVALEPLDLGEPREERLLLVGLKRLPIRPGLDRVAQPEPLLVAGDVLDLVGQGAAIRFAELRQRLGERLRRNVETQEACRDAGLELGGQPRLEPVGVERWITRRLGAERVDVRSEVAVGPVRLHEGHGGRDPAEEQIVRDGLRGCGWRAWVRAPVRRCRRRPARGPAAARHWASAARTSSGLDSKSSRHSGSTDSGEAR